MKNEKEMTKQQKRNSERAINTSCFTMWKISVSLIKRQTIKVLTKTKVINHLCKNWLPIKSEINENTIQKQKTR